MCNQAIMIDPLSYWYDLQQIIKKELKTKLKDSALQAQDYYEFARMLRDFLSELKKEDVKYPHELMDNTTGEWKEFTYQMKIPINYYDVIHQKKILNRFSIYTPNSLLIIYEGATEDTVIRQIFQSLGINEKSEGIILFDAEGKGNIKKNLNFLAKQARDDGLDLFIILDGESESNKTISDLIDKGYLDSKMFKIWEKDFEYDNFTQEKVVEKTNDLLKKNSYEYTISMDEVNNTIGNKMLMKAISDLIYTKYGKIMDDIISKSELGKLLILERSKEIILEKDWQPKLPIEKTLEQLFKKYPQIMG